jgi:hypothetical protein
MSGEEIRRAAEAAPPAGYRLPRTVADRLDVALQGRKNAPACLALAHFLARFWSSPRRLLAAFPVDRRAIAGRDDLRLSEARVRGAIAVLEEIGFLARYEPDPGKRYQRTAEGLHRRPILFRFGEEYGVAFSTANARAQTARGAPAPARRPVPRPEAPRPPVRLPEASLAVLAQKQRIGGSRVIMGEENPGGSDSPLEIALARWAKAIGSVIQ